MSVIVGEKSTEHERAQLATCSRVLTRPRRANGANAELKKSIDKIDAVEPLR